jgi:hypothetical protein
MLVGDLIRRVGTLALASLDVGVHGAALDRAWADDRHLDRDVTQILRTRAVQRGHLRPALDLKHPGCVGALDHRVGLGVVVVDP